ncbi:MAG: hypothetical protein QM493_02125 [Sulfurovum sp.]
MKKILVIASLALALTSTQLVASATVATVNGMKITVYEANKALNTLTKGKMKWAKLPTDGRKQLIYMLAPSKLVAHKAKKVLSKKEKDAAIASFWMQKQMSKITISDKAAKVAYNKMVKAVKKSKSKQKIPAFNNAKNSIKMQLAQEKVVSKLMKSAKIRIK